MNTDKAKEYYISEGYSESTHYTIHVESGKSVSIYEIMESYHRKRLKELRDSLPDAKLIQRKSILFPRGRNAALSTGWNAALSTITQLIDKMISE